MEEKPNSVKSKWLIIGLTLIGIIWIISALFAKIKNTEQSSNQEQANKLLYDFTVVGNQQRTHSNSFYEAHWEGDEFHLYKKAEMPDGTHYNFIYWNQVTGEGRWKAEFIAKPSNAPLIGKYLASKSGQNSGPCTVSLRPDGKRFDITLLNNEGQLHCKGIISPAPQGVR